MSPIDVRKTAGNLPVASAASIGGGTRTPDAAGGPESAHRPGTARSQPTGSVSVELSGTANARPNVRAVAGDGPPVDSARIAEIRNALKTGDYPLIPAQIADAMIAARHMLELSRTEPGE